MTLANLYTFFFNRISKYATVADEAGSPETPTQLINMALIILTKTDIFAHDIRTWHATDADQKTDQILKTTSKRHRSFYG